ncbi:MAG TPA: transglutaminase-like domain-containing protein [Anaerolineae bacterium]|nr:transglutaminase-like domain-containing protein [Anaerolineae bacterium]
MSLATKLTKNWLPASFSGIIIVIVILAMFLRRFLFAPSYDPAFDYLAVLKAAPAYDDTEKSNVIFSYESKDSPKLTQLREMYGLAGIAGNGTDLEKAQNLLKWAHESVKHEGNHPLPSPRDAISLLEYAQTTGHGVNCRGVAIILSEALLSIGVKARYVELLPKGFSSDIHVVTLAYLSELDQWLFLDPTYQAYFVNEAGHYLDISAIRAALLNGNPLESNREINYNGGPVDVVYLHYLSKNMYRFASPVYMGFGIDSSSARTMIVLNPAGDKTGRGPNPFSKEQITHNPTIFWEKP